VKLGAGFAVGFVVMVRRDGQAGRFGDGVLPGVFALVLHFVKAEQAAGSQGKEAGQKKYGG
jgi:hypothetical protein